MTWRERNFCCVIEGKWIVRQSPPNIVTKGLETVGKGWQTGGILEPLWILIFEFSWTSRIPFHSFGLADFSISELSDFSIWKSFEFWKSLGFRNFWNFRTFEPSDFGIRTLANFELLEFPRSNIRICKTPISSPFSDFSLSSSSFQLVQFREFRVVRVRFELSNFQTFPFSSPRGPDSSQILKIERL